MISDIFAVHAEPMWLLFVAFGWCFCGVVAAALVEPGSRAALAWHFGSCMPGFFVWYGRCSFAFVGFG